MVQIQSILAATDFSPDARNAAERAVMLAAALNVSRTVLLHVLEESWMEALKKFAGLSTKSEKEIIDEALRSLNDLIGEIPQSPNSVVEPEVRVGNTLNTIGDAVSNHDLLVLGAHGQHPVKDLALGTTSQRLLSKTGKPVLVVKRKPEKPYQRVLVAVDFSSNSRKALELSIVIGQEALIYAVHTFEPIFEKKMISSGASDETIEEYRIKAQIDAEMEMTNFLKAAGINPDNLIRLIEYGHAPGKLPEIANKWKPDLIIVGKHGRSRIEELLLGSVTLHMLSQAECDVLVGQ